jgi:protein-S-isoprenylcysteine O-methyltransferase Ste14
VRDRSWRSYGFVGVQFAAIAAIAATGPLLPRSWPLRLMLGMAIALGGWAIITMRPGTFAVLPEVRETAALVTSGPYRLVRHPMYSAVLAACAALIADAPATGRVLLWLVLLINLVLKLRHEEHELTRHFPKYAEHVAHWRLLPGIY